MTEYGHGLQQIKGSRFAIGGEIIGKKREKEFTLHTIEIVENDKFYIVSLNSRGPFLDNLILKILDRPDFAVTVIR